MKIQESIGEKEKKRENIKSQQKPKRAKKAKKETKENNLIKGPEGLSHLYESITDAAGVSKKRKVPVKGLQNEGPQQECYKTMQKKA